MSSSCSAASTIASTSSSTGPTSRSLNALLLVAAVTLAGCLGPLSAPAATPRPAPPQTAPAAPPATTVPSPIGSPSQIAPTPQALKAPLCELKAWRTLDELLRNTDEAAVALARGLEAALAGRTLGEGPRAARGSGACLSVAHVPGSDGAVLLIESSVAPQAVTIAWYSAGVWRAASLKTPGRQVWAKPVLARSEPVVPPVEPAAHPPPGTPARSVMGGTLDVVTTSSGERRRLELLRLTDRIQLLWRWEPDRPFDVSPLGRDLLLVRLQEPATQVLFERSGDVYAERARRTVPSATRVAQRFVSAVRQADRPGALAFASDGRVADAALAVSNELPPFFGSLFFADVDRAEEAYWEAVPTEFRAQRPAETRLVWTPGRVRLVLERAAEDWRVAALEERAPRDPTSALEAFLDRPAGLAADGLGNLYVTYPFRHRVHRVDASGGLSTVAGTGVPGSAGDDGPATAAQLRAPWGLALASDGTLFVVDVSDHRVRRIGRDGTITTIAGTGTSGFAGDGGPATAATLQRPAGVAVSAAGEIYIADTGNHRLRRIARDGTIATIVGTGGPGDGGDGGPATNAGLRSPWGVAVNAAGDVYVADTGNHRVRRIGRDGTIATVAGTGQPGFSGDGGPADAARLEAPYALAVDPSGALYIADAGNARVRRVTTGGIITTLAGSGRFGFDGDGGPASAARFGDVLGLAAARDGTYVADTGNDRVRVVNAAGVVSTLAGAVARERQFAAPAPVLPASDVLLQVQSHGHVGPINRKLTVLTDGRVITAPSPGAALARLLSASGLEALRHELRAALPLAEPPPPEFALLPGIEYGGFGGYGAAAVFSVDGRAFRLSVGPQSHSHAVPSPFAESISRRIDHLEGFVLRLPADAWSQAEPRPHVAPSYRAVVSRTWDVPFGPRPSVDVESVRFASGASPLDVDCIELSAADAQAFLQAVHALGDPTVYELPPSPPRQVVTMTLNWPRWDGLVDLTFTPLIPGEEACGRP